MLDEGRRAPDFELPGVENGDRDTFQLSEALADDRAALLVFYPFDFSPVCTDELCAIQDAQWFEFTPDLDVWGISADSTYAHRAFAAEYGLTFPLLSDAHGETADAFGVQYDVWEDHEGVPKRSVFVLDDDRTVRYAWATDKAYEKPDFTPVRRAIDQLSAISEDLAPDEMPDVTYDEPHASD